MTAYAAFLRGINLGGKTQVAMPRLRELAEGLGWQDVRTYINSGNLVFTSTKRPQTLSGELETALADDLSRNIDVTVRSRAQLETVLGDNPFPDGEGNRVVVIFLMRKPPAGVEKAIEQLATDREPFVVRGSEVWVHYQDGQANSKLAATFAQVVKVSATARNLNTVRKVVALFDR